MPIDAQRDALPSRLFIFTVNRSRTLLVALLTALLLLASRSEQPRSIAWAQASPTATGAVFTVNTTDDTPDVAPGDGVCDTGGGPCSLRAAIMESNAMTGTDTIAFNLSGSSPLVIMPQRELPPITDPVILDGATQSGFVGEPLVILDGSQAGASARGLVIRSGSSTVRSLQIVRFAGTGIEISGPGQNVISGNVIGGNATAKDPCGEWPFTSLPIDLGLQNIATPAAMNDCGQIVGVDDTKNRAFLWLPIEAYGLPAGLNSLGNLGVSSQAVAINNLGDVVGNYKRSSNGATFPFVWLPVPRYGLPRGMTDLSAHGCAQCVLFDINDTGQIVGQHFNTTTQQWQAFVWQDGTLVDLGALPAKYGPAEAQESHAVAINNRGDIIGQGDCGFDATIPQDRQCIHALRWEGGVGPPIDMGVLGTLVATLSIPKGKILLTEFSSATDINNSGQIVLISTIDSSPVGGNQENIQTCGEALWDMGAITDLGDCRPDGWTFGGVFYPFAKTDPPQVAGGRLPPVYNRVNDSGDVLYHTYRPFHAAFEADRIQWSDGTVGLPPDLFGMERISMIALNNNGDVLGLTSDGTWLLWSTRVDDGGTGSGGGVKPAGIRIVNSPNNLIGGPTSADANRIMESGGSGIRVEGSGATQNSIIGNTIGVQADGATAAANLAGGVVVAGAPGNIIQDNLIAGNGSHGVQITGQSGSANKVVGNRIGVNEAGAAALPNAGDGVQVDGAPQTQIGGSQAGERNTISGNGGNGVKIVGATAISVTVQGNFVGVDGTGATAVPNQGDGVLVAETPRVQIGGASGVTPGGGCTGDCNLISGNSGSGIKLLSQSQAFLDSRVEGNFIGVDGTGTKALPNQDGIWIDNAGGNRIGWKDSAAQANLISGNRGHGVKLTQAGATDNVLLGNQIGVDTTGAATLGNALDGIRVEDAANNLIGSPAIFAANTIAGNKGNGIAIVGSTAISNTLRGNALFANTKLAIDLGDDGVTPNDLGRDPALVDQDSGPNGLLNFPAGVTKFTQNNSTTVTGLVDVTRPLSTVVDIYTLTTVDPTGFGPGRIHLGAVVPDATGLFRLVLPAVVNGFVSATLTDGAGKGSTSEFSAVCGDPDGDGNPDSDGDSLCDDWEKNGIDYDGNGSVDLALSTDAQDKDIFVEIDYMLTITHTHRPNPDALSDVKNAFADAPVSNPSGLDGINLHPMVDEFLQERPLVYFLTREAGADDDFNDIKIGSNDPAQPGTPCGIGYNDGHFGSPEDRLSPNCLAILGAKRLAYRYAVYGHQLICIGDPTCTGVSGIGDLPGDDFMVTFGGFPPAAINRTAEAGTFMHELGHTLNLRHGGGDNIHNKPNFLSIMNYSFQLGNLITRPLDYSRWALASLNEGALQEQAGIDNNAPPADLAIQWPNTIYSFYDVPTDTCLWAAAPTVGDVDWNFNNAIQGGTIGPVGINNPQQKAANPTGQEPCQTSTAEVLASTDDWARVQYDMRAASDFGPVSSRILRTGIGADELTYERSQAQAALIDTDNDGFSNAQDNCLFVPNPSQADTNGDAIGDACSLAGVSFAPSPIGFGTGATGTVTLAEAAPSIGAEVRLYSRLPDVLVLPPQVTVPGDALTFTFPVTAARLTVSIPVTVALYYEGGAHTITETVTVADAPPGWILYLPAVHAP